MAASEASIAAPLARFPADDHGFLWLWDRHGRAHGRGILMHLEYGDCIIEDKKSGLSHPHHTASTACPACAALCQGLWVNVKTLNLELRKVLKQRRGGVRTL